MSKKDITPPHLLPLKLRLALRQSPQPRRFAQTKPASLKTTLCLIQFLARQTKMEKRGREPTETDSKYADIDSTLKSIDRKIKEGSALGHNKVSAMAEQFASKNQEPAAAALIAPALLQPEQQPKVQRSVIILWQLHREKNRITAAPYCVYYATTR